jgi:hypothetical protein
LLRAIVDQPNVPILYSIPGKWDMIYAKLNAFLEKESITLDTDQKTVLDQSKSFLEKKDTTLNMDYWKSLVGKFFLFIKWLQLRVNIYFYEKRFALAKISSRSIIPVIRYL